MHFLRNLRRLFLPNTESVRVDHPVSRPAMNEPTNRRRIYRTADGRFYFRFSFESQPNATFRVYVEEAPSYAAFRRDESFHATHRLRDGSRNYICWTDPLRTFKDAKAVAKAWAESTGRYLISGRRF